jgi:hypothetical protein
MNPDFEALFLDGDPLEAAAWAKAELMAEMPPQPGPGYGTYTLAWLARTLPEVRSAQQLALLLLLYRKCVRARDRTVALSNAELMPFGISRYAKYRALVRLKVVGAVEIQARNGRSLRVTLRWFP